LQREENFECRAHAGRGKKKRGKKTTSFSGSDQLIAQGVASGRCRIAYLTTLENESIGGETMFSDNTQVGKGARKESDKSLTSTAYTGMTIGGAIERTLQELLLLQEAALQDGDRLAFLGVLAKPQVKRVSQESLVTA
jgi:hypothetical protein